MPYHVYILQSEKDQSYYIGHTGHVADRLERHNAGRSLYTKGRRPWQLVYQEEYPTKAAAVRRELALKSLHRRDLLSQLVNSSR